MGDELREMAHRGQGTNLALATAAFTITFWAWNLIGPLARTYSRQLDLSPTQTSMLVAIPVLVGSWAGSPSGSWPTGSAGG
nr:hypothetical protein GCM10020093_100740 [Planobispora longispora]